MGRSPTVVVPLKGSAAPPHLDPEEAGLFEQIVRNYGLRDEVSLSILAEGMTSLQRARKARLAIDEAGMTYTDSKGHPRAHPLLCVERDARAAALSAFRILNLELPRTLAKRSSW